MMDSLSNNPFKTASYEEVDLLLAFFLWECPTSMIPSRDTVLDWARSLESRGPEFSGHAKACREWATPAEPQE